MLDKANALEKLRRQRDAVAQIPPSTSSPEFIKWKRDTEVAIANVFGGQTRHGKEFDEISYGLMVISSETPDSAFADACRDGLKHAKVMLQSMVDEIKEYWQDHGTSGAESQTDMPKALLEAHPNSSDVFVVHGHDEAMKQTVCRTLERLGLKPIVLHEMPNHGRTIIEKFTDYATAGFAIILLSADDVGCERGKEPDGFLPRARQNVILELGFFLGMLGRGRVMSLSREVNHFDLPSDYSGVIFTPFDNAEHWRFELIRELRAAKYEVDANKLV